LTHDFLVFKDRNCGIVSTTRLFLILIGIPLRRFCALSGAELHISVTGCRGTLFWTLGFTLC